MFFTRFFFNNRHDYDSTVFRSREMRTRHINALQSDGTYKESCASTEFQPYFVNKDGLYIYYRRWLDVPSDSVKGVVVLCHGLNDHSLRYKHVAESLNAAGFMVYAIDHQGHGMSEGTRLFVVHFDDYCEDIIKLKQMAETENPGQKIFLLGHSMGGLIAINTTFMLYERKMHLDGALYCSPALYIHPLMDNDLVINALSIISFIIPKSRPFVNRLPLDTLTHDKINYDKYLNDPLLYHDNGGAFTSRLATELLKAIRKVQEKAKNFPVDLPVFMMQGDADEVVPPSGIKEFNASLEACGVKDQELTMYAGGYHELMNEPDWKNTTVKNVIDWLVQHSKA